MFPRERIAVHSRAAGISKKAAANLRALAGSISTSFSVNYRLCRGKCGMVIGQMFSGGR
jgi:hypothetical protein